MPDDRRYYRLICLIAKAEIANKAEGILSERGIDVEYRMLVHGTASSEVMNLLGLGTTEKVMISAIATQEGASELLPQMRKRLYLGMPDTGVAFTIPITGGQNRLFENVSANAKDSGRMRDRIPFKTRREQHARTFLLGDIDTGGKGDRHDPCAQ